MERIVFVALLLPFLCFAQNPSTKTFPLNTKLHDNLVMCFVKEAAMDLADTYVKKGSEASHATFIAYEKKGICVQKKSFVTYTAEVHHAEGENGFMNVFEGIAEGVTIFTPRDWTIALSECSSSWGTNCA